VCLQVMNTVFRDGYRVFRGYYIEYLWFPHNEHWANVHSITILYKHL